MQLEALSELARNCPGLCERSTAILILLCYLSLLPFNSLKGRLNFDLTPFRDRGSSNQNFQDDKVGLSMLNTLNIEIAS